MADLIQDHFILNFVVAPLALLALFFFLPPYLCFRSLLSVWSSLFNTEDVAGKIVLITGASSGIGEHLAYEYGRRGACLALVAPSEERLRKVAAVAERMGSPKAIAIPADVTIPQNCQRFVEATITQFGRLDHLVTNAGVVPVSLFEDLPDVTKFAPAMEVNFWGSVYSTYFATPHLRRSKGKVILTGSCTSWLPCPRTSIYNASKAAVVNMYETLRIELGPNVGITIVNPGLVQSEITAGKFLNQSGVLEVDKQMRNVLVTAIPVESAERCARAMVYAACKGEKYLTEPAWYGALFYVKELCPDLIVWSNRLYLILTRAIMKR